MHLKLLSGLGKQHTCINNKFLINKTTFIILTKLKNEGFIYAFTIINNKCTVYFNYRAPLLGLMQISKAGNRSFCSAAKLRYNSDVWGLISTTKGLITIEEAKKYKIGGEIIVSFNNV